MIIMKSSRWDALKPDNTRTDNNKEQHSSKSRTTTTRRRKQHQLLVPTTIANNNQQHNGDNGDNNNFFFSLAHQQQRSTRHNNNNSNHLDSSSLQHPTHHHYFETLIERCCLQRRKESTDWNKSVKNLALLVGQYSNELSSQQVCRAVRDVFLPYLSVDDDNDMETGKVAILNSIRDLLQQQQQLQPTPTRNSKHMIALLAPSVDDISQAGREVQVRNPIRLALFAALIQHCLSVVVVVIMENKNQETIRSCNNLSSSLQLQQQQQACIECLTTALIAATRVEGTKYHANHNARDIEPVLIRRIVVAAALGDNKDEITLSSSSSSSNSRPERRLALELLLAYLQRHPDASSSFVSDLLLAQLPSTRTAEEQQQQRLSNNNNNNNSTSVTCPVCQRMSCASPVFLQMMHSCALWQQSPGVVQLQVVVDHQEQVQNAALVMKSLVVLLQNLPWSLWLGCGIIDDDNDNNNNNKTALSTRIDSSRSIIRMQSSTLTFRHRLVEALHNVIGMTNCYFRQQQQQQQATTRKPLLSTELNSPLVALLRTLLTKLPSKQLPEMQDSFFQLFTSMATAAVGNVENNKRHHSVLSEGCRDAFIEAFGGRMTPAGCTTKMCWALKHWLQQSTDGFAFVERLIDNVSSSKECHSLVLALVRSYPGAVLEREMVWASFRSTIQRMMTLSSSSSSSSSNDYSKLKAYQLIEGLLHGRREGEYNSSDLKAVDLFFPLLKSNWLEKNNSMTCRISACNSFGSLLPSDWKHVIKVDGGAKGIVKSLLSVCTDCERTSGKLRAAGCKAIGDISTSLLSVQEFIDNPDAALLLSEILETMNFAVNDSNSTTRCMALYAIGNVSSSLNGTILQKPIDSKVMSKTARQCLAKLSEELDEKVAGNAIRSIGHIARLALDCNHTPSFERGGIEVSKFLSQIVFALKDRIVAVLDLTMKAMENSSSSSSTKLSWKRRSAIKKHGWGACNALAGLFENGYCEPTACCPVVECLVHCLQHALEINEKVALAAMRALRSLHPDVLPNVLHNEVLSDSVTSCVAVMAEKEEGGCMLSSRLDADFKLTLGHLLQCIVSGKNAFKLLCKMSSEQALFLLEWMDKHDSPVETYAAFSLALQTLDVRLDVSVERTLSSKALRRFGESGEEEFDEL